MRHLLPVFASDNSAGWLLQNEPADRKLSARIRKLGDDSVCSSERPVQSWWITHGHEERAREAIRGLYPDASFCPQCASGVPCAAWSQDDLSYNDFVPREPSILTRPEWDELVRKTLAGFAEYGPQYLGDFAADYFGWKGDAAPLQKKAIGIVGQLFADLLGDIHVPRVAGGWSAGERHNPAPAQPGMTREEAAAILGVDVNATKTAITHAFVIASHKAHPDKGGSSEAMQKVLEARTVLLRGLS